MRPNRKLLASKLRRPKMKLGLPDLDQSRSVVLNSLRSPESQRGYRHSIDEFIAWYCSEPRLSFNKTVVTGYRLHLEACQLAHWAIVDLVGKGGHIRTVPVPDWVKQTIDDWLVAAGITSGRVFRCVRRAGTTWGEGMSERVVWRVVKEHANKLGLASIAPHVRRSCARLCHTAGGEMEQIQFLLGHVSVQTTEKYLKRIT